MTKREKEELVREDYQKILDWMETHVISGNPWPEGRDLFYLCLGSSCGITHHFGVSPADRDGRQIVRIRAEYGKGPDLLGMPREGCGVKEMEGVVLKWADEKANILAQLEYANRIRNFEP